MPRLKQDDIDRISEGAATAVCDKVEWTLFRSDGRFSDDDYNKIFDEIMANIQAHLMAWDFPDPEKMGFSE